jgi:tripartite-type tricarboxylate transporter receptor subunit TctC
MPKEVITRLSIALHNAQKSQELIKKYAQEALEMRSTTPEEFGAFIKTEVEKWGAIIKEVGIQPQ